MQIHHNICDLWFPKSYLKIQVGKSNSWNWQINIKILGTVIGWRKLPIYMTGVFIQLHSRVIDSSALSFFLLNANSPQYLWFMVSKKLRKASGS